MTTRPKKTRVELEDLILAELRRSLECDNIDRVGITLPISGAWDFIVLRNGPFVRPECRKKISKISAKLRAQYDLAD
jgi:hypothetical protein